MLRITAMGLGATEYYIENEPAPEPGVAAGVATGGPELVATGPTEYFAAAVAKGESGLRWAGSGMEALGLTARAGDVCDHDVFRAVHGELRRPESTEADPVYIGRKPPRYKSEAERYASAVAKEPAGPVSPERERELRLAAATDGREGVGFYDFTFSPVKTASVYAAALRASGSPLAGAVEAAHDAAVLDAIAYAEAHAIHTRTGWHGATTTGRESVGKHEAGVGASVVTCRHSTSREDEPNLHTHALFLNRTATADGKIGALDGAAFRAHKELIEAAYSRSFEQRVSEATGARFERRPDGKAREIVGVDPELVAEASTRRTQVSSLVAERVAEYRERTGHDPSPRARKAITDEAVLETRKAKGPESGPSAVDAWSAARRDRLAATVAEVAARGHHAQPGGHTAGTDMSAGHTAGMDMSATAETVAGLDRAGLLKAAIEDVQAQFSVWTVGNLGAAISARLGDAAALGVPAGEQGAAAHALAEEAIRGGYGAVMVSAPEPVAVPAELCRADGGSLYRRANGQRYATAESLAAETRILARMEETAGVRIAGPDLEVVRVEAVAAGLSADQVEALCHVVSSGKRGDALVGPAGAGKSRTVSHLSRVWSAHTGGRVIGVATSQIAADNLARDGVEALNSTRFLAAMRPDEDGETRDQLTANDFVVIDEAGMSSRDDIDAIAELAAAAGAKVLLTGDPSQLGAVAQGGVFRHVLDHASSVVELEEVHRFVHDWEKEASLKFRGGDTAAIDAYADRGRLHVGTIEQMQAEASRAWLADTVSGLNSLLIVSSNEDAASLSAQLRTQLIELGQVETTAIGRIQGGQQISVGDRVQTRRNLYDLRVDPGPDGVATPVYNRGLYTVTGRDSSGYLTVRDERGAVAHLPADYVEHDVVLAYAVTDYGAQGVTVDTGHPVLKQGTSLESAYPSATRGAQRNDLYLVGQAPADVHEPEQRDRSEREAFAAILTHSGAERSGLDVQAEGLADAASLGRVGHVWDLAGGEQASARYGQLLKDALGAAGYTEQVSGDGGEGRLIRALREAELGGHDVAALLGEVTHRDLGDADSVPDVLRWRIRQQVETRTPERVVDPGDWTTWAPRETGPVGDYLHELAVASTQRQATLGREAAEAPPAWALTHLGPVPDAAADPAGRAAWEAKAGVVAAYRTLTGVGDGEPTIGPAPSREREVQHALWTHARTALGNPSMVDDYSQLPVHELYAQTERWAREQATGPAWVADDMRAAYEAAADHRVSAALRAAELETEPAGTDRHARLVAERDAVARSAAWHAERAARLEIDHAARAAWDTSTREVSEAARLSTVELERRGLPIQRPGTTQPGPGQTPPARPRPSRPGTARPKPSQQRPGQHQPTGPQPTGPQPGGPRQARPRPTPYPRPPAQQPPAQPEQRPTAQPDQQPDQRSARERLIAAAREATLAARERVAHARGRLSQLGRDAERVQTARDDADRARRETGMAAARRLAGPEPTRAQQRTQQHPGQTPALRMTPPGQGQGPSRRR